MAYFYSTARTDKFTGGTADDWFYFWPGYMSAKDKVNGGGGKNALVLVNDYDVIWSVSKTDWPTFSNVGGIALLSRPYEGFYAAGFNLTFDNNVLKSIKNSPFIIDASELGLHNEGVQINASSVTNVSFDIFGSTAPRSETDVSPGSRDKLLTGSKNDRFIYYANSLNIDTIDGGAGTDTIVLVGAGLVTTKNGKEKVDPNGITDLTYVKNVENIVVTDLSAGQSRTIRFAADHLIQDYKGRNPIKITTDRNYGTSKTEAVVNGKLIVDGSVLTSKKSVLDVKGGNAGDLLIGGAANDTLSGDKGNDTLVGGGGEDTLSGGSGDDLFLDDRYLYDGDYEIQGPILGNRGSNKMYGGAGNDTFVFSSTDWKPSPGKDLISGGAGTDTLRFAGGTAPDGGLDSIPISSIEIVDFDYLDMNFKVSQNLLKNNHDENGRLWIQNRGGAGGLSWTENRITVDASDLTDARYSVHIAVRTPGKDYLVGGAGDDVFDYSFVSNKSSKSGLTMDDTITGGGGNDTILVSEGRSASLGGKITGIETLRVINKSNVGDNTNIILATKEAISVDGSKLGKNDSLIAQGYYKNPTTGKLYEAIASLQITGGKGNDILSGGRADDRLIGGSGDDTLTGNKGSDKMTGGKGADHFVFTSATDSLPATGTRDFITDFHQSEADKIEFLHTGVAYSFIGSSAFQGKAGEVRSYMSGSNTYVQLDEDGDGVADLGIGLSGKITLTQSDFIL